MFKWSSCSKEKFVERAMKEMRDELKKAEQESGLSEKQIQKFKEKNHDIIQQMMENHKLEALQCYVSYARSRKRAIALATFLLLVNVYLSTYDITSIFWYIMGANFMIAIVGGALIIKSFKNDLKNILW